MILVFAVAFFITFVLTPLLLTWLEKRGITGTDLHKPGKIKVPEMGGIAILAGFSVAVMAGYFFYRSPALLVGLFVVLLVGGLGVIDGIKRLSPLQKVAPLTAVGLILVPLSNPYILGHDMGLIYLICVPVFFMFACNFTNMLAGFNGLEVGTGAIASFGMAVIAYMDKSIEGLILSSAIFGALLAFLFYNRYPARAFPGDVGTLIIGAAIFITMVISKEEILGGIILIPYIADAALKYFSVGVMTRESQTPTQFRDGKLYSPEGGNMSLPRLLLRIRPMTEKGLVLSVWAVEAMFVAIAILGATI